MSEHAWKPGDRVMRMGTVCGTSEVGVFVAVDWDGTDAPAQTVPTKYLHPIPPLLTPEAQAVLDAVTVWREEDPNVGACYLLKAHDAYIASITPPHPRWKPRDPLDVAKEALEEIAGIADSLSIGSKNWAKAALEKIAALEAGAKEGGR